MLQVASSDLFSPAAGGGAAGAGIGDTSPFPSEPGSASTHLSLSLPLAPRPMPVAVRHLIKPAGGPSGSGRGGDSWNAKDDNQEVENSSSSSKDLKRTRSHYESIITAVRVRPMFASERKAGCQRIVHMPRGANQTVLVNPAALSSTASSVSLEQGLRAEGSENSLPSFCVNKFTFDHSFWSADNSADHEFASQQDIYDQIGTYALHNALLGYNCSVFAYGQTSAGKTYTMMGEDSKLPFFVAPSAADSNAESSGLIPRLCAGLFEKLDEQQREDASANAVSVQLSYVQVYHERVYDLLDTTPVKESLKVREHPEDGVFVENATHRSVVCLKDIQAVIDEGNRKRYVAATSSNQRSSRSHAILTIELKQVGGCFVNKKSKLCLVDLAGSERVDLTSSGGSSTSDKRLRETGSINRSLSTLADVICALSKRHTVTSPGSTFIPYRNSVLTRLLKESLGGNAKTVMLAAISPCCMHYEETMSTLKYVERAKSVLNNPKVNTETSNELQLVEDLRKEIQELRAKLLEQSSSTTPPKTLSTMSSTCSMASTVAVADTDPGDDPQEENEKSEQEKLRMEREIAKLKAIVRKKDRQLCQSQTPRPKLPPALASASSTSSLTLRLTPTPSPLESPLTQWSSPRPVPCRPVGPLPNSSLVASEKDPKKPQRSKEWILAFALSTVLRHRQRYDKLQSLLRLKWNGAVSSKLPPPRPLLVSTECNTVPIVVSDASVSVSIDLPVLPLRPEVASIGCNTTPPVTCDASVEAALSEPKLSVGCNTLQISCCDASVDTTTLATLCEKTSIACNTTPLEACHVGVQVLIEPTSPVAAMTTSAPPSKTTSEVTLNVDSSDHDEHAEKWNRNANDLLQVDSSMDQLTNQMEMELLLSERDPAQEEDEEPHQEPTKNRTNEPQENESLEPSSGKDEKPELCNSTILKPLASLEQVVDCMKQKQSCVGLLATFVQCVDQMYHFFTSKRQLNGSVSFGNVLRGIENQLLGLEDGVRGLPLRQMDRNGDLSSWFECLRPIFDHFCDVFMCVSMDSAVSNQLLDALETEIQNGAIACVVKCSGGDEPRQGSSGSVAMRLAQLRLSMSLLLLKERFASRISDDGKLVTIQQHPLVDEQQIVIRRLQSQIQILETQNDVLRVSFEVSKVPTSSRETQTVEDATTLATLWEVPEEEDDHDHDHDPDSELCAISSQQKDALSAGEKWYQEAICCVQDEQTLNKHDGMKATMQVTEEELMEMLEISGNSVQHEPQPEVHAKVDPSDVDEPADDFESMVAANQFDEVNASLSGDNSQLSDCVEVTSPNAQRYPFEYASIESCDRQELVVLEEPPAPAPAEVKEKDQAQVAESKELPVRVFVDAFTEMDEEDQGRFVIWHQRALEVEDLRTTVAQLQESLRTKEELIWFLDSKMAYYEHQMTHSNQTISSS